jgi:hypothetical protein
LKSLASLSSWSVLLIYPYRGSAKATNIAWGIGLSVAFLAAFVGCLLLANSVGFLH